MKRAEEENYHENLSLALIEYKKRVERFDVPSATWFIENFNLIRNGKPITPKRWHNIICDSNLTSYRTAKKRRDESILADLASGVSTRSIKSEYKLDDHQLNRLVNKKNSLLKEKSLVFLEPVCALYQKGFSISYIEKELGISAPTIRKLLAQRDIHPRSQSETSVRHSSLRTDYFKKIDSPEKAWILGFIYADGSINQKNSLQISQSRENDHLLKIVSDALNYPNKFTSAKKSHTDKIQSVLTITRQEIFLDLLNLGMTQNKENNLRFPFTTIDPNFYWAFLSGLYNGDGGLTFGLKRNTLVKTKSPGWIPTLGWQITSTKEMCLDIRSFFETKFPNIQVHVKQEGTKNAWRVTIANDRSQILSIVQELDRHGYGIQISDKYDKAAFYQRRWRRNAAIKAVQSCPDANIFKQRLNIYVDNLRREGMLLKDIATSMQTDRNSLRRYCEGRSFPSTTAVISKFCSLLQLKERDFIDWARLESQDLIPPHWELKDSSYRYHGLQVGVFGEIIEFGRKDG